MGMSVIAAREDNPNRVREILHGAGIEIVANGTERLIECRRGDETCSFAVSKAPIIRAWQERYGEAALGAIQTGVYFQKHAFLVEVFNLLREKDFLLDGPWPVPPRAWCPKCGHLLRTALAKQCFTCGANWH